MLTKYNDAITANDLFNAYPTHNSLFLGHRRFLRAPYIQFIETGLIALFFSHIAASNQVCQFDCSG
jgi:hypothetical protein